MFDYLPTGWPDKGASLARLDRAVKRLGCGSRADPDSIVITCFRPQVRVAACAMLAGEFKCFCGGVGITVDQCPALFDELWKAGADAAEIAGSTATASFADAPRDARAPDDAADRTTEGEGATGGTPVAHDALKPE